MKTHLDVYRRFKSLEPALQALRGASPGVGGALALGGFTIPALPLSVVYAPPADAEGSSCVRYGSQDLLGAELSLEVTAACPGASPPAPASAQRLCDARALRAELIALQQRLALQERPAMGPDGQDGVGEAARSGGAGAAAGALAAGLEALEREPPVGVVRRDGTGVAIRVGGQEDVCVGSADGGSGAGDVIHFLQDAKFAWLAVDGRLLMTLLGGAPAALSVARLKRRADRPKPGRLSAAMILNLLALDPFVAGGVAAALPAGRFRPVGARAGFTVEYGRGEARAAECALGDEDAGLRPAAVCEAPLQDCGASGLEAVVGGGAGGLKAALSLRRLSHAGQPEAQAVEWELHSDRNRRFAVELWLDRVFGTVAFRQAQVCDRPRFEGVARRPEGDPWPGQWVALSAEGRSYCTVAGRGGRFAFFSASLPAGKASLEVGDEPGRTVFVGAPPEAAGGQGAGLSRTEPVEGGV